MVHTGLCTIAVLVHTPVQAPTVDVTVNVYVLPSILPATTFTDEPVIAVSVPFPLTDQTNVAPAPSAAT